MAKLNLKYYDYNDLIVYNSLKSIDDETKNILNEVRISNDKYKKIKNVYIKNLVNPQRKNVLKWFPFNKKADVLEVNSGLGGLTEYLCEKVKSVTSVSFILGDAQILNERLSEKENLEIVLGDLDKIVFDKKFDYIILNDILEYSKYFFEKDAYKNFINYFKILLKPSGKVFLIVSNKFGIKSWAGIVNEHTLRPFDEIENYKSEPVIESLSRNDLDKLMDNLEFNYADYYYPVPNYIVPHQILTEKSFNYLNSTLFDLDDFTYSAMFETKNIINNINKSGEFSYFANSFVIMLSNDKTDEENVYYSTFNNDCMTNYIEDKDGNKYIKTENITKPEVKGVKLLKYKKSKGCYISENLRGKSLYQMAYDCLQKGDDDSVFKLIEEFAALIKKIYSEQKEMTFVPDKLSKNFKKSKIENVLCVQNAIDNIDVNTIYKDGKDYILAEYNHIIDEYVPVNYLIFAGLYPLTDIKYSINIKKYLKDIGISDKEYNIYCDMYEKIKMG